MGLASTSNVPNLGERERESERERKGEQDDNASLKDESIEVCVFAVPYCRLGD